MQSAIDFKQLPINLLPASAGATARERSTAKGAAREAASSTAGESSATHEERRQPVVIIIPSSRQVSTLSLRSWLYQTHLLQDVTDEVIDRDSEKEEE